MSNARKSASAKRARIQPGENAAVVTCIREWNKTFHKELKELDEGEDTYAAKRAANEAYIRVMPHLGGFEETRDFIACVTYALVHDILMRSTAQQYFAAAKVAVTALRCQPKPPDMTRGPGRPPKNPAPKSENN